MPSSRVAVVSDIHGNHLALAAFRSFLDANPDITRVLNAGDMINIGPRPYETAEHVLDDPRFVSIMGNNEEMLASAATSDGGTNRHRRWTFGRLPNELRDRLTRLPAEWTGDIDGIGIFMTHSRPGNSNVFPVLYDHQDIHAFARDYEAMNARVVIFGHTHEPMCLRHGGRIFVNPGALGISRDGRAGFAILTIDAGHVDVAFHSLPYDVNALTAEFILRDVPDKEYILDHFYGINSVTSL